MDTFSFGYLLSIGYGGLLDFVRDRMGRDILKLSEAVEYTSEEEKISNGLDDRGLTGIIALMELAGSAAWLYR